MSGAAVAARGAGSVAKTSSRSGWLGSLKDDAVSFLKGENNAPWAILAESVIGCIPVLGQLVDARDIIKGLIEVSAAPASPAAWFNLIMALIGLIPGGGDAAKRSMRAIKSGAVHTDELLDMIRRLYKGDPEKLLKDVLDVSKLRKQLDQILSNPRLRAHLGPEASKRVDAIQSNLNKQFDAFKKEIDDWLTKGRRTSAQGGTSTKASTGTPSAKPNTQAKSGVQAKTKQGDAASANTPNAATQRTTRFKSLTQKVLGVLGEHMADYHCQDVKGWGVKVRHDSGDKTLPNSTTAAVWFNCGHACHVDVALMRCGPRLAARSLMQSSRRRRVMPRPSRSMRCWVRRGIKMTAKVMAVVALLARAVVLGVGVKNRGMAQKKCAKQMAR